MNHLNVVKSFLISLLIMATSFLSADQSDVRDFSEYIMTGYYKMEALNPIVASALDVVIPEYQYGWFLNDPGRLFIGVGSTGPVYDSELFLGWHDITFGKMKLGFEVYIDPFALAFSEFYTEFDASPSSSSLRLRSRNGVFFGENEGIEEIHIKKLHIGGRIQGNFHNALRIKVDAAMASFQHLPVTYFPGYDPDEFFSQDELSDFGTAIETKRVQLNTELSIYPETLFQNAPHWLPDVISLDATLRDDLTPEGYVFSSSYSRNDTGKGFGSIGYGKTRNVLFSNILFSPNQFPITVQWSGEVGLESEEELFTRQFFVGWDLLRFTDSDYFFISIGPKYAAKPLDIVDLFPDQEPPRAWTLTIMQGFALDEFLAGYLEADISEFFFIGGEDEPQNIFRFSLLFSQSN